MSIIGKASGPAILLYHRIAAAEVDPFNLCIPLEEFVFQIKYLKDRCMPMSLTAMLAALTDGRCPNRAVVVTFDDAYRDNLTAASPVLLATETPATFFATTGHLHEEGEFWWDTLTRLLLMEPGLPPVLTLDGFGHDLTLTTDDRHTLLRSVHGRMRTLSAEHRDVVLQQVLDQIDSPMSRPQARPLTSPELKQLASRPGHEIGAHTRHHLSLPFQSEQNCFDECRESRESLEELLDRAVRSLAYPFGEVTGRVAALAAAAGFTSGLTTEAQPVTAESDLMRLPRLAVPSKRQAFIEQLERLLSLNPVSDHGARSGA